MDFEECEICGQYENVRYMTRAEAFGQWFWACFDCAED